MKEIFNNMDTADLCYQLALLVHSGVPLNDGLYLLAEDTANPTQKETITLIAGHLDNGGTLADAFSQPGCFSVHMIGLLKTGEQTGHTEETLLALARYYEDRENTNRQLRSMLTYPSILLLMMLIVIIILLSRVLPIFDQVYASLGGSLTGIAGVLLSIGNVLNTMMPVLCILLALILLFPLLISLFPGLRHHMLLLFQKHFGDKGIWRKMNDARFAQALTMTYSSGLSLEECISLSSSILSDCPGAMKRADACMQLLENGVDLAAALKDSSMLPASACKILSLGFRAGTGDQALKDLSQRLAQEAQNALEEKISMIEPALVVVTSILVGAILLTVMLPLMNIMKALG